MDNFLELNSIEKEFNNKKVLSDLNLNVKNGLITIIMGKNGVGKTTLINIILGLLKAENGTITFKKGNLSNTVNIKDKKEICYIPDTPFFLEYLTGLENLRYIAKIYNRNCSKDVLRKIMINYDLNPNNKTTVNNYSRGMKTKLNLCFIEIIDASFVILDEPTIGLDITSIEFLKKKILSLKKKEKTFLITSHDMEFVRSISDEIYLLNNRKTKIMFDHTQKQDLQDINKLTRTLLSNMNESN